MAKRPVLYEAFGKYLAGLRKRKGWTQSDAGRHGAARYAGLLTRQVILHLEAGKTKDPDPDVLRAVAAIYDADYVEVAANLASAKYGCDLGWQAGEGTSNPHPKRGSDVPASVTTRLQQLTDENAALKARLRDVQTVTRQLFAVAIGRKASTSRTRTPRSGSSH